MQLDHEIKAALDAFQSENKTILSDLQARYDALKTDHSKLQTQLDAVDLAGRDRSVIPGGERKTLADHILEHPEFKARTENGFTGNAPLHLSFNRSAFVGMERKTNITDATLGFATSGVLLPVRLPGVYGIARQQLRIRDVMRPPVPQTQGGSFDFALQSVRSNATSPQVEASPAAESTYLWTTGTDQIRTIAHFTNVSRQALSDVPWMQGTLNSELIYGLKIKEEAEILSGAGTGVHLNGIITQSTVFDTATYLTDTWQRIDQLRKAKLQATLAGLGTYAPNAYVLHPSDMAALELTKDAYGRYLIGDPQGASIEIKTLWDLPVVESFSITAGTFLVGAFDSAATLIDRQEVSVEISFEHASNFTALLATVLCTERIGLAVEVPGVFIHGSFSTSPA
jgi:HK97 family phage major capsid protein